MVTTPNLDINHIEQAQAQKEVTTNEGLDRLDQSNNTYLVIAMSDANLVLSETQQCDAGTHEYTGALTANRNVTWDRDRKITVYNNTSGGKSLVMTTGSGTTVTIAPGEICIISIDVSANKIIRVGGGGASGLADDRSGEITAPEDRTYTLIRKAVFAFTINSLAHKLADGSCTVTVQIDGVTVTGLSALNVTNAESEGTATANNTVAVGQTVTFIFTNTAVSPIPDSYSFTLNITRS